MGPTSPDQLTLELRPEEPRLPRDLRPMLARTADKPFDDPDWLFQPSWDGLRALAHLEGGRLRLVDARGRELTDRFPELLGLVDAVDGMPAVLDGEIAIPDAGGRPDPDALQRRLRPADGARRARVRFGTATYLVNDLPVHEGRPLLRDPLVRRRRSLEAAVRGSERLVVLPDVAGEGTTLFEAVAEQGLPGMLARRADSPYLPGVRSDLWRQVRTIARTEGVVGGYRIRRDGGLTVLLGAWERDPSGEDRLVAIGEAEVSAGSPLHAVLQRSLRVLASDVAPFRRGARADHRWVRPELVVGVEHGGRSEGRLQRARLVAIRDELDARGCRLPPAVEPEGGPDRSVRPVLALLQRLPLGD
jgi:bifunctional non-homologous end joining protein LigD